MEGRLTSVSMYVFVHFEEDRIFICFASVFANLDLWDNLKYPLEWT